MSQLVSPARSRLFAAVSNRANRLAVGGDAVVAVLGDRVGRIVTDHEITLLTQQVEQDKSEPRVLVVEHAHLHGSAFAFERWREAVHRDQHGSTIGAGVQQLSDAVVVGGKYGSDAGVPGVLR
jgi:hypothetical protein